MKDWNKTDIREVVKLPEWQRLRESLVGTWMKTPEQNVKRLREFLGSNPDQRRLRIVHNYLTGTAFRLGKIKTKETDRLLAEVRKARGHE